MSLQSPAPETEPKPFVSSKTPRVNGSRPVWSDEAVAMLRRLWPQVQAGKLTAKQVARMINAEFGTAYSKCAVVGRAFRMDMSKPTASTLARPYAERLPSGGGCRWPLGHPGEPGFRFCEAAVASARGSYCQEYRSVAYRGKEDAPTEKVRAMITRAQLLRLNGLAG